MSLSFVEQIGCLQDITMLRINLDCTHNPRFIGSRIYKYHRQTALVSYHGFLLTEIRGQIIIDDRPDAAQLNRRLK